MLKNKILFILLTIVPFIGKAGVEWALFKSSVESIDKTSAQHLLGLVSGDKLVAKGKEMYKQAFKEDYKPIATGGLTKEQLPWDEKDLFPDKAKKLFKSNTKGTDYGYQVARNLSVDDRNALNKLILDAK